MFPEIYVKVKTGKYAGFRGYIISYVVDFEGEPTNDFTCHIYIATGSDIFETFNISELTIL
jgi:hypothetical protein